MGRVKRVAPQIEDHAVKVKAAGEPANLSALLENQGVWSQRQRGANASRARP
jgi:hypothetical protein